MTEKIRYWLLEIIMLSRYMFSTQVKPVRPAVLLFFTWTIGKNNPSNVLNCSAIYISSRLFHTEIHPKGVTKAGPIQLSSCGPNVHRHLTVPWEGTYPGQGPSSSASTAAVLPTSPSNQPAILNTRDHEGPYWKHKGSTSFLETVLFPSSL